jgi:hypothetical protein
MNLAGEAFSGALKLVHWNTESKVLAIEGEYSCGGKMDGTLADTKLITGDEVLELAKWENVAEQFEDILAVKCVVFPRSRACICPDLQVLGPYADDNVNGRGVSPVPKRPLPHHIVHENLPCFRIYLVSRSNRRLVGERRRGAWQDFGDDYQAQVEFILGQRRATRAGFLDQFCTEELLELEAVYTLENDIISAVRARCLCGPNWQSESPLICVMIVVHSVRLGDLYDIPLASGLDVLSTDYQKEICTPHKDKGWDFSDHILDTLALQGYMVYPLSSIWEKRKSLCPNRSPFGLLCSPEWRTGTTNVSNLLIHCIAVEL